MMVPSAFASPANASRIIDTHTHFYDPTRPQGVPWPAKDSFLNRRVLPPDWQKLASPFGIRETVVVEASAWVEDNDWILKLADEHPCIVGFVGNLDPSNPAFAEHLLRLSRQPLFRGIRIQAKRLLKDVSDENFRRAINQLADRDLSVDINGVDNFAGPLAFAQAFPSLRIVVDHVGNVRDPHEPDAHWLESMSRMGSFQNVYCKVSGLVEPVETPQGKAPTDTDYYRPTLDHVSRAFGDDRIFFGSNWPVSDKGSDFAGMFRIVANYFSGRSDEAREKFYWRNSLRAYRWVNRR